MSAMALALRQIFPLILSKTPRNACLIESVQKCDRISCHASVLPCQLTQTRGRYIDWRMLKDAKRRQLFKENYTERMRINALRKNTILPPEIQEMATKEINSFPRDATRGHQTKRCVLTSRPRSTQMPWRLSRIMWRHLADYNKMSGVTRSSW